MLDKRNYEKVNDKKILHKIHKNWVTVSVALIGMIGVGAVSIPKVNAQNNDLNQDHHINVKDQINKGFGQAYTSSVAANRSSIQTTLSDFVNRHQNNSAAGSVANHANYIASQYQPTKSSTQITNQAKNLTGHLISNYLVNRSQQNIHKDRLNSNWRQYDRQMAVDNFKYNVDKRQYEQAMSRIAGDLDLIANRRITQNNLIIGGKSVSNVDKRNLQLYLEKSKLATELHKYQIDKVEYDEQMNKIKAEQIQFAEAHHGQPVTSLNKLMKNSGDNHGSVKKLPKLQELQTPDMIQGLNDNAGLIDLMTSNPTSGDWGDTHYSLDDSGDLTISSYVTSSDATGYSNVSVPVTAYSDVPETEYSLTPSTAYNEVQSAVTVPSQTEVISMSNLYNNMSDVPAGTSWNGYTKSEDGTWYDSNGWSHLWSQIGAGLSDFQTGVESYKTVNVTSYVPSESAYTSYYQSAYTSYYESPYTSYSNSASAYTYTSYTTHSNMQQGSDPLSDTQRQEISAITFEGADLPNNSSGMFSGMSNLEQITTDSDGIVDNTNDNLATISPNGWKNMNNGAVVQLNHQLSPNTTYQAMPRYFVDYKFGDQDLGQTYLRTIDPSADQSKLTYSVNGKTYAVDPRTKLYANGLKDMQNNHTYTVQLDQTGKWGTATYYLTPDDTSNRDYQDANGKALPSDELYLVNGTLNDGNNGLQGANITSTSDFKQIDIGSAVLAPVHANYLFANLPNLQKFSGKLNTGNTTSAKGMFSHDSSMKSLDLSSWDTHQLTNVAEMFSSDPALQSLDISSLRTNNDEAANLLKSDRGLRDLKLGVDTSNQQALPGATSDWYHQPSDRPVNLANDSHLLAGWYHKITQPRAFVKYTVNGQPLGFHLFILNHNTSDVPTNQLTYHYQGNRYAVDPTTQVGKNGLVANSLSTYTVPLLRTGYWSNDDQNDDGNSAQWYVKLVPDLQQPNSRNDCAEVILMNGALKTNQWVAPVDKSKVSTILISDAKAPADSSNLFSNLPKLSSVQTAGLNMSDVSNAASLFSNDPSLLHLDLSTWQLPKLTNMSKMFMNDGLQSLDISGMTNEPSNDRNAFKGDFIHNGDQVRFNPKNLQFDRQSNLDGSWMSTDTYCDDVDKFGPRPLTKDSDLGGKTGTWVRVDPASRAVTLKIINQSGVPVKVNGTSDFTIYRPFRNSTVTPLQQLDHRLNDELRLYDYRVNDSHNQNLSYLAKHPQTVNVVGDQVMDAVTIPAVIYHHDGTQTMDSTTVNVRGRVGSHLSVSDGDLALRSDSNNDNVSTDYNGTIKPTTLVLSTTNNGYSYHVTWANGVQPTATYVAYHGLTSSATSTATATSVAMSRSYSNADSSLDTISTFASDMDIANDSLGRDYNYLSSIATNPINQVDASMQADVSNLNADWAHIRTASADASHQSQAAFHLTLQAYADETVASSIINSDLAYDQAAIAQDETSYNANTSANSAAAHNAEINAVTELGSVIAGSHDVNNLRNQVSTVLTKATSDRDHWNAAKNDVVNILTQINRRVNTDNTTWRNSAAVPLALNQTVASASIDSRALNTDLDTANDASNAVVNDRKFGGRLLRTMANWLRRLRNVVPSYDSSVDLQILSSAASVETSVNSVAAQRNGLYSQVTVDSSTLGKTPGSLIKASNTVNSLLSSVHAEYLSASSASVVASNSASSTESSGVLSGEQTASSAANAAQGSLMSFRNDQNSLNQAIGSVTAAYQRVATDSSALNAVDSYMTSLASAALGEALASNVNDINTDGLVATRDSNEMKSQGFSNDSLNLVTKINSAVNFDQSVLNDVGDLKDVALASYTAKTSSLNSDVGTQANNIIQAQQAVKALRGDIQDKLTDANTKLEIASNDLLSDKIDDVTVDMLAVFQDRISANVDRLRAEDDEARTANAVRRVSDDNDELSWILHLASSYLDNN